MFLPVVTRGKLALAGAAFIYMNMIVTGKAAPARHSQEHPTNLAFDVVVTFAAFLSSERRESVLQTAVSSLRAPGAPSVSRCVPTHYTTLTTAGFYGFIIRKSTSPPPVPPWS